jgi:hypothetical protein
VLQRERTVPEPVVSSAVHRKQSSDSPRCGPFCLERLQSTSCRRPQDPDLPSDQPSIGKRPRHVPPARIARTASILKRSSIVTEVRRPRVARSKDTQRPTTTRVRAFAGTPKAPRRAYRTPSTKRRCFNTSEDSDKPANPKTTLNLSSAKAALKLEDYAEDHVNIRFA